MAGIITCKACKAQVHKAACDLCWPCYNAARARRAGRPTGQAPPEVEYADECEPPPEADNPLWAWVRRENARLRVRRQGGAAPVSAFAGNTGGDTEDEGDGE